MLAGCAVVTPSPRLEGDDLSILRAKGVEQKGASHNEEAWATRIHGPLIRFFGTEKDPIKREKLMTLENWADL
ncbi:MAG TPA: hypothetical protein DD435_05135 [Cyanobacteria bacterium UBA8530]|nr:hypothetical protein [Cyanobacteria bacterium UBA8530]